MSSEQEYFNEITDSFVRAVYETMGTECGVATVVALKEVLGKAWKDGIILRKLANENPVGRRIRFKLKDEYRDIVPALSANATDEELIRYHSQNAGRTPKKINCIKAIRQITGLGLVDAKNICEQSYESWRYAEIKQPISQDEEAVAYHHRSIQEGMSAMMDSGWTVTYA